MRRAKTIKSSGQNGNHDRLELLKQAKHGDPGARKKLRQMGLLYWEHQGRVIVRRLWANGSERHTQMPPLFSRYSPYPAPSDTE